MNEPSPANEMVTPPPKWELIHAKQGAVICRHRDGQSSDVPLLLSLGKIDEDRSALVELIADANRGHLFADLTLPETAAEVAAMESAEVVAIERDTLIEQLNELRTIAFRYGWKGPDDGGGELADFIEERVKAGTSGARARGNDTTRQLAIETVGE